MKTITFVVEGLAEAYFLRPLLIAIKPDSKIKFVNLNQDQKSLKPPRDYNDSDSQQPIEINVILCGNDAKVNSFIFQNQEGIFEKGSIKIIGIRDVKSSEYDKLAKQKKVHTPTIDRMISNSNRAISQINKQDKISIIYSTMEIESWFMGIPNVLKTIDKKFDYALVMQKLGIDLKNDIIEFKIYNASGLFRKLYRIFNKDYKKSTDCFLKITSKLDINDFDQLYRSNKSVSFNSLYSEIQKL